MKRLIIVKNGEEKEVEMEYLLKDKDIVEKINGKWCLVRQIEDRNEFKEFLSNNKVDIAYMKDKTGEVSNEEKLFEVKVTSVNSETGETHEIVVLENAPFEWLK
ncbi:MAG: hypothetical protein ACRCV0_01080 [Brevinema sp.]